MIRVAESIPSPPGLHQFSARSASHHVIPLSVAQIENPTLLWSHDDDPAFSSFTPRDVASQVGLKGFFFLFFNQGRPSNDGLRLAACQAAKLPLGTGSLVVYADEGRGRRHGDDRTAAPWIAIGRSNRQGSGTMPNKVSLSFIPLY